VVVTGVHILDQANGSAELAAVSPEPRCVPLDVVITVDDCPHFSSDGAGPRPQEMWLSEWNFCQTVRVRQALHSFIDVLVLNQDGALEAMRSSPMKARTSGMQSGCQAYKSKHKFNNRPIFHVLDTSFALPRHRCWILVLHIKSNQWSNARKLGNRVAGVAK